MSDHVHVLPTGVFAFASAERAPLYTALIYAFGNANDQLLTSLALDDVRTHLAAVGWRDSLDDSELADALQQLRHWRLVDAGQNHSEVYRTAQEYERRNLQYSLTRDGEAALAGHQAAVAALQSSGGLQSAVLEAIAETLGRLADLAKKLPQTDLSADAVATHDQRRAFAVLQELLGHLDAMRTGIRTFNSDLQRLLRAEEVNDEIFSELKEATLRYLDDYVTQLDARTARIHAAIMRVRGAGLDHLLHSALHGAELPPHPEAAVRDAQWLEHTRTRWAGLEAWFAPHDDAEPRAQHLSATARRAIVSLLQVVDRMRTARRRPSSAQADFRRMAEIFANAPSDADLHRIWRASFGLHAARHTSHGHDDADALPTGISWLEADAVPVSALLRESGLQEKFSRPAKVRDVANLRAARAKRARAEQEATERALRVLGADGPVQISDLTVLDPATFGAFLDLLGRAISRVQRQGARHATSADGRIHLTLREPPEGARAQLQTTHGVLDCPDYEVQIRATTMVVAGEATA